MDKKVFDMAVRKTIIAYSATVLLFIAVMGLVIISLVVGSKKIIALFSKQGANNLLLQAPPLIIAGL
jgi:hypothetical protein